MAHRMVNVDRHLTVNAGWFAGPASGAIMSGGWSIFRRSQTTWRRVNFWWDRSLCNFELGGPSSYEREVRSSDLAYSANVCRSCLILHRGRLVFLATVEYYDVSTRTTAKRGAPVQYSSNLSATPSTAISQPRFIARAAYFFSLGPNASINSLEMNGVVTDGFAHEFDIQGTISNSRIENLQASADPNSKGGSSIISNMVLRGITCLRNLVTHSHTCLLRKLNAMMAQR